MHTSIKACNIMRRKKRLHRPVCMMLCVHSKINVTVSEDTAFPLVRKKRFEMAERENVGFFPSFLPSNFSPGFK